MSETLYVRSVRSVSRVEAQEREGEGLLGLALPVGGLLAGLGFLAARALSEALTNLLPEASGRRATVRPIHGSEEARRIGQELAARAVTSARSLPPLELRKVQVLAEVAAYTVRPDEVKAQVRQLVEASTPARVEQAARALHRAVRASHNRVMARALAAACRVASTRAGFPSVRTEQPAASRLRVIAEDPAGRALVTEIRLVAGEVRLMAEVVGVTGPGCHTVMDTYVRALEQAGVRFDLPLFRKPTGGVPELEASREYIRRRSVRPARTSGSRTQHAFLIPVRR